MTIGAIAELIVETPRILHDPIMHKIPTLMLIERFKLEEQIK